MEGNLFISLSNSVRFLMGFINKIKEKKLPHFLLKLLVFLSIIFLLDFSIGSILKYWYYEQDSGLLYRATYAIDSTRAEILIFGSSTANHHYSPGSFENRTHLSFYNTGRDGNTIFYNYSILQGVLRRYSPKIVILDLNRGEFKVNPESYDRISSLLPYYNNHPKIRSIIQLKSPYEKYKLLSKIYPFNSMLFTIAVGTTEYNKSREYINDKKGYVPLNRVWKREITTDASTIKYGLDSNKTDIFKFFITDCMNSNVKLYIFISPTFKNYTHEDPSIEVAQKIANESNIPFYNFSGDTSFLNHIGLFADVLHLNDKGAKIYSNRVVDKIQEQNPNTFSYGIK